MRRTWAESHAKLERLPVLDCGSTVTAFFEPMTTLVVKSQIQCILFWTKNIVKTLYFVCPSTESEQNQRKLYFVSDKMRVKTLNFVYHSTIFDN